MDSVGYPGKYSRVITIVGPIKENRRMALMKAVQGNASGAGLTLVHREIPEPKDNEVPLKVEACGICHGDGIGIAYAVATSEDATLSIPFMGLVYAAGTLALIQFGYELIVKPLLVLAALVIAALGYLTARLTPVVVPAPVAVARTAVEAAQEVVDTASSRLAADQKAGS
jgi:hypothetical protein